MKETCAAYLYLGKGEIIRTRNVHQIVRMLLNCDTVHHVIARPIDTHDLTSLLLDTIDTCLILWCSTRKFTDDIIKIATHWAPIASRDTVTCPEPLPARVPP